MPEQQPNAWSCCQCGSGPYLWALFRACTNMDCRHQACTCCTPEFLRESDHPTDIQDQFTSCTGVGPDMSQPAPNGGQDCFDCMGSAADDQPSHCAGIISGGSSSLALGSESTHDEALPAPSPSLLPSQPITTSPEHCPSGPGDQPVDGEWLWVCSECGAGSWLMSTTQACLTCGHVRCVSCQSWEV